MSEASLTMPERLKVRLGGYAPESSTHSEGLRRIAALLAESLEDTIEVSIEYNVLDAGRQVHELLDDVEAGRVTACYFSTSYLVEHVPDLAIIDLPYLFNSLEHAHRCLDGELGHFLSERVGAATNLVILGYWDNGFRHLSNRVREVRSPQDCRGLRVRLQPNWAHEQFFETLGAVPVCTDLRDGIEMIKGGEVDAQENPFANFVAYGVELVHPYLTLTGHAYGARAVIASRAQLDRWPERARSALRRAASVAIEEQRRAAIESEAKIRASLEVRGTDIATLSATELEAFRAAASPALARAHQELGEGIFRLLGT